MLSRIAHELYWVGRRLSRAEHTARMLDGLFHADLQGRPDEAGIHLTWDGVLAIMGHRGGNGVAGRAEVVRLLTVDPDNENSIVNCVGNAREAVRVVRDVCSAEMWEAINTFHLGLQHRDLSAALKTGPYSIYSLVKERCGLFWGLTERTMLRDEGHAFLEAGARIEAADMVLRMLRVAYPPAAQEEDGAPREWHGGQALALLQAVGGLHAFRRAVPEPPHALPVARFLLFEHAYPDSVAASVERLHAALLEADPNARSSPPVLRVTRLLADMDFRRRAPDADIRLPATFSFVQEELDRCDRDISDKYFGGAVGTHHAPH